MARAGPLRLPLAALVACACLWGPACAEHAPAKDKGRKPMADAEMTLDVPKRDVITGESLALKATVRNTGNAPFVLHAGPASAPEFELRSAADGQVLGVFSQESYIKIMGAGRQAPPLPGVTAEVQPGESHELREDPALYATAGLPPGRYHLVCRAATDKGEVASAPVEITVRPAHIRHLASLYCGFASSAAMAFDHTDAEGAVWLFQNETESEQVDAGVFHCRGKLDGQGPLDGLALAVKTGSESDGRWVAWLRGGSLGGVLGESNAVIGKAAPVAVDLAQPRLVEPGFQADDGSALFLVAGLKGGAAFVQPCIVSAKGVAKGQAAPLARELPARILANRIEGDDGDRIRLVWAEKAGDATHLYAREYGASGAPLPLVARRLYTSDAALQALELWPMPIPGGGEACVHAFSGPQKRADAQGKPQHLYTLARIPLDGPLDDTKQHVVVAPQAPVRGWAVSGLEADGRLLVLANLADGIVRTWAGGDGGWEGLAQGLRACQGLRVVESPSGYWAAVWTDPASGVRYAPDPSYGAGR
ncbi:MAG TPA: hypothetical protein VNE39_18300 [Planctomycetota bacterium]|nr:hypothetical protein [Planctomycetota bacterium]